MPINESITRCQYILFEYTRTFSCSGGGVNMYPGDPAGITGRCADTCHPANNTKEHNINRFRLPLFYLPNILLVSTKFGFGIGVFGAGSYLSFCCLSIYGTFPGLRIISFAPGMFILSAFISLSKGFVYL